MVDLELLVTLWPSFPHFSDFSCDDRLAGIRLNSAMIDNAELELELDRLKSSQVSVPLWFDVKGRQPRVQEVYSVNNHLELSLNHSISVETPVPVLFKAGADDALLERVEDRGRRLIFRAGPEYVVKPGESLHIRHPSFRICDAVFTDIEKQKIQKVKGAGFNRYILSYVESQRDIDEFIELVGKDSEVWLKIETVKGLKFAANKFKKKENLVLVAARGDLYVEVDRPHDILAALKLVIEKDPKACVASRMLLSVIHEPVPSCADFAELAWLTDIGYRTFMLCDELCLKGELLGIAINVFESFRESYSITPKLKCCPNKRSFKLKDLIGGKG